MNECKVCGKEISDRATTCGTACRVKLSRQSVTSVTDQSVTTPGNETPNVTPAGSVTPLDMADLVEDLAGDNCQCGHCSQSRNNGHNRKLNHGDWLSAEQLEVSDYDGNRVSIPGDVDYVGTCKG